MRLSPLFLIFPVTLATMVPTALLDAASSATPPNTYPQAVIDQYIKDCSAGRGGQASTICRCIITGIQATYTYPEFQILNRQIAETGQTPPRLTEIVKSCRARPSSTQVRRVRGA
jgi:hypothetical protein